MRSTPNHHPSPAPSRFLLVSTVAATLSISQVHATDFPVASQAAFDALNSTDFAPGDRILLQSGMTFTGSLDFTTEDGGTATFTIVVNLRLQ